MSPTQEVFLASLCALLGLTLLLGTVVSAAGQDLKLVDPDEAVLAGLQINPLPYATGRPLYVPLSGNYWEIYPTREDVSIRGFRQIAGDHPGVLLSLRTALKDFSHYRYTVARDSLAPEPARDNSDGEIPLRFARRNKPESQRIRAEIQAVSKAGRPSSTYGIEIGYYPKELYASGGQTSRSWLVVQNSDLSVSGSAVEDWILDDPPPEDRAYAQRRWGGLLREPGTDLDRARILARSLTVSLKSHRGIPSDTMLVSPPFRQLEMAEAGRGGVACENYAAIFSWACNALGVPARRIGMNYPWSTDGECNLEIAEGHNSSEIFDRNSNRWVWVDLTFNALGVTLGDKLPLNMAELIHNLNDPARLAALQILEFDPDTGKDLLTPVLQSRQKIGLLKYFKKDQQFRYQRRP